MLSQDLNSLKEKFSLNEFDGVSLTSNQVTVIVKYLHDCESKARQMEASPIATGKRLTAENLASENLVLFPIHAHPNSSQVYREQFMNLQSANDDGGDAA